jgi:hypothetical protein
MKTLAAIKAIIADNRTAGRDNQYEGLTSAEIGKYNGYLMFGENDEAFPDAAEWSRIVD